MPTIFKGNDKTYIVTRRTKTGEVIKSTPLQMIFTVRTNFDELDTVLQKEIGNGIEQNPDGSWSIKVDAKDTRNLKITDKKLVLICDVKIVNENGEETTIVKPQDFVVLPVVTN